MISVLLPLVLAPTVFSTLQARQNTRQYIVSNKCPTSIDLYIAGSKEITIQTGGSYAKTLSPLPGFFYTDANGGNANSTGTVRAGFYDDFYYMVADPNYANTGLQVSPVNRTADSGFCEKIECDGRGCPEAFSQPPTRFPDAAPTAPTPPYYRCPANNTDYDITFCPTGQFPDQGQPIHFDYFQNKCLDVQGGVFANGTPVQIYDCNGTQAQRWIIQKGSTKVQVAGTNLCLDAGTHPANGVPLKLWKCFDNLPAQEWYYTDDDRIALENQGFCMDLADGIMANGNKVQTWLCSENNNNQVWTP